MVYGKTNFKTLKANTMKKISLILYFITLFVVTQSLSQHTILIRDYIGEPEQGISDAPNGIWHMSPDIWFNPDDKLDEYNKNPEKIDANSDHKFDTLFQSCFIYIRLKNTGDKDIDAQTKDRIQVNWAKGNMYLRWSGSFDKYCPVFDKNGEKTNNPFGGKIGVIDILSLKKGETKVFKLLWNNIPSPNSYRNILNDSDPSHFCLYVRVVNDSDHAVNHGMGFKEHDAGCPEANSPSIIDSNFLDNIKQGKRIALRNCTIVPVKPERNPLLRTLVNTVAVSNYEKTEKKIKLRFISGNGKLDFLKLGSVNINLNTKDENKPENIFSYSSESSSEMVVTLKPNERRLAKITFGLKDIAGIALNENYPFTILQYNYDTPTNNYELVGGETFLVRREKSTCWLWTWLQSLFSKKK